MIIDSQVSSSTAQEIALTLEAAKLFANVDGNTDVTVKLQGERREHVSIAKKMAVPFFRAILSPDKDMQVRDTPLSEKEFTQLKDEMSQGRKLSLAYTQEEKNFCRVLFDGLKSQKSIQITQFTIDLSCLIPKKHRPQMLELLGDIAGLSANQTYSAKSALRRSEAQTQSSELSVTDTIERRTGHMRSGYDRRTSSPTQGRRVYEAPTDSIVRT